MTQSNSADNITIETKLRMFTWMFEIPDLKYQVVITVPMLSDKLVSRYAYSMYYAIKTILKWK